MYRQNKQWFSSGTDFFNEAICEKVTNRSFILREFGKKFIMPKRKEMAMQLDMLIKGELWVIEAI